MHEKNQGNVDECYENEIEDKNLFFVFYTSDFAISKTYAVAHCNPMRNMNIEFCRFAQDKYHSCYADKSTCSSIPFSVKDIDIMPVIVT